MNAINVVKPFQTTVISEHIEEHILERNPTNVINVVKPFRAIGILKSIKEDMLETNYDYNQCGKAFVQHNHP